MKIVYIDATGFLPQHQTFTCVSYEKEMNILKNTRTKYPKASILLKKVSGNTIYNIADYVISLKDIKVQKNPEYCIRIPGGNINTRVITATLHR